MNTLEHKLVSGLREFYLGLLSTSLPAPAFDLARSESATLQAYYCIAEPLMAIVEQAHGEATAHAIEEFLKRTGQYITNDASRQAAIAEAVAIEREACAQEADRQAQDEHYGHAKFRCANIAVEIRARGGSDGGDI